MRRLITTMLVVLGLFVLVAGRTIATEAQQATEPAKAVGAACPATMQGLGVSEEGREAMRVLMQSDHAPKAMVNMMEMARRMGSGDVMRGMTRMMEMMGGGMVGGRGGMMEPGRQPGK